MIKQTFTATPHLMNPLIVTIFYIMIPCVIIASDTNQPTQKIVVESTEGRKYEVVKISRKSNDSITFTHAGGVVTFRANELTLESRELLGMVNNSNDSKPGSSIDVSKPLPDFSTHSRQQACSSCMGRKTLLCVTCKGSGFGSDVQNNSMCDKCVGQGKTTRPMPIGTSGGALKKKETHYSNIHVITEICKKCNGSGKLTSSSRGYCNICNGSKVVQCSKCK